MRWLRYSLAAVLAAALIVGMGLDWWNDRPYVVTGIAIESDYVVARYTLPRGGTGEWQMRGRDRLDFWCWDKAEIGKTIPDCMRANWKARTSGF